MKDDKIATRNPAIIQYNEHAVSPVVGVMLMLVVTIIIAAIVSAFGGGLLGGSTQKTPQLTVDTRIANGGYWSNSLFSMTVTGEDQVIPTKDIKLVTSWNKVLPNGTPAVRRGNGYTRSVQLPWSITRSRQIPDQTAADDWYAVRTVGIRSRGNRLQWNCGIDKFLAL